jgi:hypothetical protein
MPTSHHTAAGNSQAEKYIKKIISRKAPTPSQMDYPI